MPAIITTQPTIKLIVNISFSMTTLSIVDVTGMSENDNEHVVAGKISNALFHHKLAHAVDIIPIHKIASTAGTV